jgi:hypothetical protein
LKKLGSVYLNKSITDVQALMRIPTEERSCEIMTLPSKLGVLNPEEDIEKAWRS